MNEEFPSNSRSRKIAPIRDEEEEIMEEGALITPEKKLVRKSIRGRATIKKKSWAQSIAQAFIGDDSQNVVSYILNDVLLPAAKNTIQEMVQSGIEMLLFGETKPHNRSRGREKDRSIVSYGKFYKDRDDREENRTRYTRDKFDLSDIYFKDHSDAEDVLTGLCDLLEEYEQVTVADYFDLAGIEGATWAHNKWGWENLRKGYCTHTRHGYAIVLPDPIELD